MLFCFIKIMPLGSYVYLCLLMGLSPYCYSCDVWSSLLLVTPTHHNTQQRLCRSPLYSSRASIQSTPLLSLPLRRDTGSHPTNQSSSVARRMTTYLATEGTVACQPCLLSVSLRLNLGKEKTQSWDVINMEEGKLKRTHGLNIRNVAK